MAPDYLERPGLSRLAYSATPGDASHPAVVFLGGFRSDMTGTKATYLEAQCRARNQPFVRFDYSGHGRSEGDFETLTLSRWKEDAYAVITHLTKGKAILAGSSMGGWLALLLTLEMPEKVSGLVGIAAAADFTRDMVKRFSAEQKAQLATHGYVDMPGTYGSPSYRLRKEFLDDGEKHCLLDRDNLVAVPVRLVQGMHDPDVEWQTAFRIRNALAGDDVKVILIESGDHRLSRPEDLELIDRQVRIASGIT
jgi:pimeloyl-ACP methyl ester carboxylesterase